MSRTQLKISKELSKIGEFDNTRQTMPFFKHFLCMFQITSHYVSDAYESQGNKDIICKLTEWNNWIMRLQQLTPGIC